MNNLSGSLARSPIGSSCTVDSATDGNDDGQSSKSLTGHFTALSSCSGFLTALDSDPSHIMACYTSDGSIQYLSRSVFDILGYTDLNNVTKDEFPVSRDGDTVFRTHKSGVSVRFLNTFYSKSDSGEVYTIDKLIPANDEDTYVVMKSKDGEIVSVSGDNMLADKLRLVVGRLFPSVTNSDDLADALLKADCAGKYLNLSTELVLDAVEKLPGASSIPLKPISVSMDIYSRLDGLLVACVRAYKTDAMFTETNRDVRLNALLAEIEYLRDFRDNTVLPIYSVNHAGTIVWANDAMIRMMGYENHKSEYLGSPTNIHHVDQALVLHMLHTVLDGDLLIDFPCQLKRRDGSVFHATYNSNCRFDPSGTMAYSRCIVQDATEARRIQQEKLEIAQHNEQAARQASQMKSDFIATMSHEIRTPINGVIGTASLLSTTEMTEEQSEYVNTIVSSAEILMSLVHNILDISKIESGKFELDKVPIRFCDLVNQTCRVMYGQALEKGINFVCDVSPELNKSDRWHYGDPTRLTQILRNFLSNALKFTHKGSVTCRVREARDPSAAADVDTLLISVTDTGIGIEDCSKLFQDFVQAAAHINKQYGGTGLGLSISRKLVQMMNGEVGMSSELGKGTTVWARIPLIRAPVPAKAPSRSSCCVSSRNSSSASASPRSSSPRLCSNSSGPGPGACCTDSGQALPPQLVVQILVAEDNKVNQKMLKRMLEKLGFDAVTMTADGQQAVDAVKLSWEQGIHFDIILMDCLMPTKDGWEATAEIREFERVSIGASKSDPPPVPAVIMALTANATEDDKEKSLSAGMNDFLVKPITLDRLNIHMSEWVSKLGPSAISSAAEQK